MPARFSAACRTPFRFLSVGAINTLLGLTVIFFLKWTLDLNDLLANLTGYGIGLTVSHVLNGRWTFSYKGRLSHRVGRFAGVVLIAYILNLLTVVLAIHAFGVNAYVAQAFGIVPYTIVSYFGLKHYAYR